MSSGSATSAACADELAALAAQRDGGQRALADDHRVDELHRDVAGVRARGGRAAERDQAPAAREALRHPVAQPGDPLGLRLEEALAGLDALADQGVEPGERRGHAAAPTRPGTSASQCRNASTPSPVRAETSMRGTPGCTASRFASRRSTSRSRCGEQVDLVDHARARRRGTSAGTSAACPRPR